MSLQTWYSPSFNGDFRFEPSPVDPQATLLWVSKPTPLERKQLLAIFDKALEKGWVGRSDRDDFIRASRSRIFRKKLRLAAPLEDVGPVVTAILRPGRAVMTAIKFKDGRIEVCETSEAKKDPYRSLDRPSPEPALPAATTEPTTTPSTEPSDAAKALAKKPDAEAAATVKRPTPCCPNCYEDAVGPATDALLAFMNEEQHEMWARERCLSVRGGLSGHRYLIAHRNSVLAAQWSKITYDLDDQGILHFHDWLVPPEEEVLAAMLILGSRFEGWLRNEATTFFGTGIRFKNPFGDGGDGVIDSSWTTGFGYGLGLSLGIYQPTAPRPRPPGAILYNGNGSLYNESSYGE